MAAVPKHTFSNGNIARPPVLFAYGGIQLVIKVETVQEQIERDRSPALSAWHRFSLLAAARRYRTAALPYVIGAGARERDGAAIFAESWLKQRGSQRKFHCNTRSAAWLSPVLD